MDALEGEVAIVTGASSGIGKATATALAADGANVALAARREGRLHEIAEDIERAYDVSATPVPTDVTEETQCQELIDQTIGRHGRLDVLVNNAGVGRGSDVAGLSTEEYRTMMAVNTDGCFFTTRAALPELSPDGHAVFVGSIAGEYPRPANPVYAATKWWVRGFAHSLAAQYGDDGLAVTVVNPSEVRTGFGDADGPPFRERFEAGTVSEPGEIAEAIAYAAACGESVPFEIDLYRRDKFADTF